MPIGDYGPAPRYDERENNQEINDTEMQEVADQNAESGRDAIEEGRRNAARREQLPDGRWISETSAHYARIVEIDAEQLRAMEGLQAELQRSTIDLRTGLETVAAQRRRQAKVGYTLFSVLGIGFLAEGILLGLMLGGVLKASDEDGPVIEQMKMLDLEPPGEEDPKEDPDKKPEDPKQDPIDPAKDPIGSIMQVSKQTVQQWAELPNEMLYAQIEGNAFVEGEEWSIQTWLFVAGTLSIILSNLESRGRIVSFSESLVSDETLEKDYKVWLDDHQFDTRYLWDKSAEYPQQDGDGAGNLPELTLRAVRMDYLQRISAKAVEQMEDDPAEDV